MSKAEQEVFCQTKDRLARPYGWTKKAFEKTQKGHAAYCLVGGIRVTVFGNSHVASEFEGIWTAKDEAKARNQKYSRILRKLANLILVKYRERLKDEFVPQDASKDPHSVIVAFNDSKETTKKEVISVLGELCEK